MNTSKRVIRGSIPEEYAQMEGIELVPAYYRDLYKLPFVVEKRHPTFFEDGCHIPHLMMLDSRPVDLKYWFALSDEWAQTDYCTKRLHHTGDYEPLDIEHQLLVATVDLDPRAIEAAFRKLAGKPSGGEYSHLSLLLIGASIWNTRFVPIRHCRHTWESFVTHQNEMFRRNRKATDKRQAAIDAFDALIAEVN